MANEKRLFAYCDILGFKEMIKTKESDISAILKKFINNYPLKMNRGDYEIIYFSDTIIFYTKTTGYCQQLFWDMIYIAQVFVIEMLQNEIPIRGVVNYGELSVDIEKESKIKMFWGQGLIDAYDAEKEEKIIGLFILPDALSGFKSTHGLVECYPKRFHVKYDGRFFINLFPRIAQLREAYSLRNAIYDTDPQILDEIAAYYFLKGSLNKHPGEIADKYKNTLTLADAFLGYRLAEMHDIYSRLDDYYEIYHTLHEDETERISRVFAYRKQNPPNIQDKKFSGYEYL
jgi:hypothetical protein